MVQKGVSGVRGVFFYVVFLLLLLTVFTSVCFSGDDDDVLGGSYPSSSGVVGSSYSGGTNFGSNILKDIFINGSQNGWRESHVYIFRIFLFMIIVAVVTVAARKANIATRNGALVITVIVAFISSISLDTQVILYLFDLMVLAILCGLIFYFVKTFLDKMGLTNHAVVLGIIFLALSLLCFGIQGGAFGNLPGVRAIRSITFWHIGDFFFFVMGIICLIMSFHFFNKASGGAMSNMMPKPFRRGGGAATSQVARDLPNIQERIDRLNSFIDNAQGTDEEIRAVDEEIAKLEEERIRLKRRINRIKNGVDA